MRKENLAKLQCQDCNSINYQTNKNKRQNPDALELKKFCKNCRKHTDHKETKK